MIVSFLQVGKLGLREAGTCARSSASKEQGRS